MTLSVSIRHGLGAFHLDAAFRSDGGLTALFGASGSGKTSVVNVIAGLTSPNEGKVEVDGRLLLDTATRIDLPPHRRRLGYVFQDARLFPHLTVRQNLTYGRHFSPRNERFVAFGPVVDLLGLGALLDRRPAGLSGGERQRVAIGRALLASPRLILMDEPLASLDEARKAEILPYIERLRDELNVPIVYVSHALAEVTRLATDVVVLSGGRVAAAGPAAFVLSTLQDVPDTSRADIGSVLDLVVAAAPDLHGLTLLRSSEGDWYLPGVGAPVGTRIRIRVRARDVMLALDRPAGISALNILPGTVDTIAAGEGSDALVSLRCGTDRLLAQITGRSIAALRLQRGRPVYAVVKSVTIDSRLGFAAPPASAAVKGR